MREDINALKEKINNRDKIKEKLSRRQRPHDFNLKSFTGYMDMSQSQSIRVGNFLETNLVDFIKSFGYEVIHGERIPVGGSSKKKKEIDIQIVLSDKILCLEVKSNLNLDSEKSKATMDKIDDILESKGTGYEFKVLSIYYKKYDGMRVNTGGADVIYMGELFKLLNIDITEDDYNKAAERLGTMMMDNDRGLL